MMITDRATGEMFIGDFKVLKHDGVSLECELVGVHTDSQKTATFDVCLMRMNLQDIIDYLHNNTSWLVPTGKKAASWT